MDFQQPKSPSSDDEGFVESSSGPQIGKGNGEKNEEEEAKVKEMTVSFLTNLTLSSIFI